MQKRVINGHDHSYGTEAERLAFTQMVPYDVFMVTSGTGAGKKYEYRGATAGWVQTHDASGTALVADVANQSGVARNRFISAITGVLPVARASTVTISIATPGVVAWTAHGFADGTPMILSTTGALPTGLTADTTYYIVAGAANAFQLSATSGGAAIATSGTQSGTHTAKGHNGVAEYTDPGVSALKINSVKVVSGTLPVAANTDFTVRLALVANDAAAAVALPIATNASSPTRETGQVSSFNIKPVWNGTSFALVIDKPIDIAVTGPISKLYLIHNIGTLLVLQFDISAVEAV